MSSCANLLFTSQPNLVMESIVHSSLHSNCHHQIIYARFNLKIYYPLPFYEHEIWHYKKVNIDLIQKHFLEISNSNENSNDKKEAIKALQNKFTSTIENAKSE